MTPVAQQLAQWANDFNFEADLDQLTLLETQYQQQHQAALAQQQAAFNNQATPSSTQLEQPDSRLTKPTTIPLVEPLPSQAATIRQSVGSATSALNDKAVVETLGDHIAEHVTDYIKTDLAPHLSQLAELDYDNRVMAEQIEGLLALLEKKEQDILQLQDDLTYYQHLVGHVYWKH